MAFPPSLPLLSLSSSSSVDYSMSTDQSSPSLSPDSSSFFSSSSSSPKKSQERIKKTLKTESLSKEVFPISPRDPNAHAKDSKKAIDLMFRLVHLLEGKRSQHLNIYLQKD